jgi:type 1 glutamine amidotransferase
MRVPLCLLAIASALSAAPLHVLVVTGGHSYPTAFYTLFEGYPDLTWDHAVSQDEAYKPGTLDAYDVLVLHDLGKSLPESQQTELRRFVEKGKGVVVLHHAIADYGNWMWWWQDVTGGHYFLDNSIAGHSPSSYRHDEDMVAKPVKGREDHPILGGVGVISVNDETYRDMWLSPKATVLMDIDHPRNDRAIVYVGPNPAWHIVTVQLGHSAGTFRDPKYRLLVHNAIIWSAGRL